MWDAPRERYLLLTRRNFATPEGWRGNTPHMVMHPMLCVTEVRGHRVEQSQVVVAECQAAVSLLLARAGHEAVVTP